MIQTEELWLTSSTVNTYRNMDISPYEAADPWLFFAPVAASDDCVITAMRTHFIRVLFTNLRTDCQGQGT